jgi:LuxR family transcriptional regulator of csgAB operon
MNIKTLCQQENRNQLSDVIICIIGPNNMHNDLIAYYLESNTGAKCIVGAEINHIPLPDDSKYNRQPWLGLWDSSGSDLHKLLMELKSYGICRFSESYAALFNVKRGLGIEEKCLRNGIRGFFYEADPLCKFIMGVQTIFNGKLWISRDIMAKCLLEAINRRDFYCTEVTTLTPRQIEVLSLISRGWSNKELADKLCISPHTVKTHLYTIFQTINVSNRIQAATWASKHLQHLTNKC